MISLPSLKFFERGIQLFGALGAGMAVLMFVALIEILLGNLRGDTSIWIQPLATLLNCGCWVAYGLGRRDWFVFVPNVVGVLVASATLLAAL